ncbi:MAG: MaoC/PaaZ C-terminal domain-containing protein [Hyphomonadaceae bacterium]
MNDAVRWEVGAELPARSFGPVTRTILALYAGGSGDHNPIHIDNDFARAAGQPDVFAHGMLSMAYLAQYISGFVAADRLRSWSVRFTAVTPVNAMVTCSGRVLSRDGREVTIALMATVDDGAQTVIGEAQLKL